MRDGYGNNGKTSVNVVTIPLNLMFLFQFSNTIIFSHVSNTGVNKIGELSCHR